MVGVTGVILFATALIVGSLSLSRERAESERARGELARVARDRIDREFLARLEAIRLNRVAIVDGRYDVLSNKAQAALEYEAAFREAGYGDGHGAPHLVAARLASSRTSAALVAALDDWSICVTGAEHDDRRHWLLEVARIADRDPTGSRDRLRDAVLHDDRAALREIATDALTAKASVQLLVGLGERIQVAGGDAIPFLRQVQREFPGDFWANFMLGVHLNRLDRSPVEAVRYHQAALAIRPDAAYVFSHIGMALSNTGRNEDAVEFMRQAIRLDPSYGRGHSVLGTVLQILARYDEAESVLRTAIRLDARDANAQCYLATTLVRTNRDAEAIVHFREAIGLDPSFAVSYFGLGSALESMG